MRPVQEVKVLGDYRLGLTVDDGIAGSVDLSALVGEGVFALWREHLGGRS